MSDQNDVQVAPELAQWLAATCRAVYPAETPRRVLLRRRFASPIEELWSACSEPERLARWFGKVSGELQVGGDLTIDLGMEHGVASRILHCEPPHRIVITWAYGGEPPQDPADEAELRLTADGTATLLELEHRSMNESDWLAGVGAGWEATLIQLGVYLGHEPEDLKSEAHWPAIDEEWTGFVAAARAQNG
jgi:uncharacterized protein YndB with AHSA1/START domain